MLRTRLWMGAVLVALTVGVVTVDQWLAPTFPLFFFLLLILGELACLELGTLLPSGLRPSRALTCLAVGSLIAVNWLPHVPLFGVQGDPWFWIASVFAGVIVAAFLFELVTFREPGTSVVRMATTVWIAGYLGLLPSFLAQLRWQPWSGKALDAGVVAIALAIFVPKCGDIGAYFAGRFLGRHRMAPVLSPKKTWEGAAGGLAAAVLAAFLINRIRPVIPHGIPGVVGFGISLGISGMLGDLAESLIKRDCRQKDASHTVPGFGGVLDVVDAILFAAPVAYWWLH